MPKQIRYSQVTEENFRSWNEDMIDKYDPEIYHTKSNFLIKIIINMMIGSMLQMLNLKPYDRILEVGCGAGNILERILPAGKLFGVDISSKLLRKAQNRCADRAELLASNAEKLPFKAKSFDKVICTEVIEHLLLPEKCLSEIKRIARDDATIVITTTNEDFLNRVKSIVWKLGIQKFLFREGSYQPEERMDDEWHLHAFNPKNFKQMLGKYFKVQKVTYIPSLFFPIHIIVKCGSPYKTAQVV